MNKLIDSFIVETDAYSASVSQDRTGKFSVSIYKKVIRHDFGYTYTENETNERFNNFTDCMAFVSDRLRLVQ